MDKNIADCFNDCANIKQVFEYAKSQNISLRLIKLQTGDKGFKVVSPKDDYAIIEVLEDRFDRSVNAGTYLHPYGSNIGYDL